MSVKLIAVDMDGTFLNEKKQFNRKRFLTLFEEMKRKDIEFVVASGNALPQLQKYFHEEQQEITFVAENGAYIVEKGVEHAAFLLDEEVLHTVIEALEGFSNAPFVLCGKAGAYVRDTISDEAYALYHNYYPILTKVSSYEDVVDGIFKVATAFDVSKVADALHYLSDKVGELVTPVASGFGFVDLIQPGIHKGNAIQFLQEEWNIRQEECVAFGDSPNDLEMFEAVGTAYALANAVPVIKEKSTFVIGDHNTETVLDTIEEILHQK